MLVELKIFFSPFNSDKIGGIFIHCTAFCEPKKKYSAQAMQVHALNRTRYVYNLYLQRQLKELSLCLS